MIVKILLQTDALEMFCIIRILVYDILGQSFHILKHVHVCMYEYRLYDQESIFSLLLQKGIYNSDKLNTNSDLLRNLTVLSADETLS